MSDLYSSLRKRAGWAAAFPFYWAGSTALILGLHSRDGSVSRVRSRAGGSSLMAADFAERMTLLADGGVPPDGYELYDEESGKYICPHCQSRLLRIGDYAECTNCGEQFRRKEEEWQT